MSKYCWDYRNEAGFPGCCGSCHGEDEGGYGELMELYVPVTTGADWFNAPVAAYVCCATSDFIRKKEGYE